MKNTEILVFLLTIFVGSSSFLLLLFNTTRIKKKDSYKNNLKNLKNTSRQELENEFNLELNKGIEDISKKFKQKYGVDKFNTYYKEYEKLLKIPTVKKANEEKLKISKKYGEMHKLFHSENSKLYNDLLKKIKKEIDEQESVSKKFYKKYWAVTIGVAILVVGSFILLSDLLSKMFVNQVVKYFYETRNAICAYGISFSYYEMSWIFLGVMISVLITSFIMPKMIKEEDNKTFLIYIGNVEKSRKTYRNVFIIFLLVTLLSFMSTNTYYIFKSDGIYVNKITSIYEKKINIDEIEKIYQVQYVKENGKDIDFNKYKLKMKNKEMIQILEIENNDKKQQDFIDEIVKSHELQIEKVKYESDIKK